MLQQLFPAIQNMKTCLPISYTPLFLQYLTVAPSGVVKYLRVNADFLMENTANGIASSMKLFLSVKKFNE